MPRPPCPDPHGFTDTELRLLRVLRDGEPHPVRELMACLDEYTAYPTLAVHVSRMRPKLRRIDPSLQIVVQVVNRRTNRYRLVRVLLSPLPVPGPARKAAGRKR